MTQAGSGYSIGLYVFDGSIWVTGDVTSIVAGTGLTGGGTTGDITINVDTATIATVVGGLLTTHELDWVVTYQEQQHYMAVAEQLFWWGDAIKNYN